MLTAFGTQGSQVRILPLRPRFQKLTFSSGLADRPLSASGASFLQRFSGRVHGRFGRAGRLVPVAWLLVQDEPDGRGLNATTIRLALIRPCTP